MELCNDRVIAASLNREADARPYILKSSVASPDDELQRNLTPAFHAIYIQLKIAFRIPESCVGLMAFLEETRRDLISLDKVAGGFRIPGWAMQMEELIMPIGEILKTDATRDSADLRSQPKNPLRDYLWGVAAGVATNQVRTLRAVRGLITLEILSCKGQISGALAVELKRWMSGNFPPGLTPNALETQALWALGKAFRTDSETVKVLNHVVSALKAEMRTPFDSPELNASIIANVTPLNSTNQPSDDDGEEGDEAEERLPPDPFRSFLAEPSNATARKFSGVPRYDLLYPFELEITAPLLLKRLYGTEQEEVLAAILTLFTRVLPSAFSRVPINQSSICGLWIDANSGSVCWNLDEAISRSHDGAIYVRSDRDRFVRIPLPIEISEELTRRMSESKGVTRLDQLFQHAPQSLKRSTKALLRKISLSSHRPTLTRLSRSWGRYVLTSCRDEVYASAIGIDFTIGTKSNFNYAMLRGKRLTSILKRCYQSIGLSGKLALEAIPDVGSRRLPSIEKARTIVRESLVEIELQIRTLPKRCTIQRIMDTQGAVVTPMYGVFKILTATRPLEEETATGSSIDLLNGNFGATDKRTSPYHERRLIELAATLTKWLNTYLGWLRLVAYRFSTENRLMASMILSAVESDISGDHHPLFFRFISKTETIALGSNDLSAFFERYETENNAGRHLLDSIFREAHIDSAAIMGFMGRANPGQETYGRWSVAVPTISLARCANTLESWLSKLMLPSAPSISPRQIDKSLLTRIHNRYFPKLLRSSAKWARITPRLMFGSAEPCPFERDTARLASVFSDLFSEWRKSPPPCSWFGVALSLVLEDGVIHQSELVAALSELHCGKIYVGAEDVFIDTKAAALGIRRLYLSPVTIRLASKIPATEAPPEKLLDFSGILTASDSDGQVEEYRHLQFVIACATAYFSVHMPSILFAWSRGAVFARTSRPEAVARHTTKLIEPPRFDLRRQRRAIAGTSLVAKIIKEVQEERNSELTHFRTLIVLKEKLSEVALDGSIHSELAVGFLKYLAGTLENFQTLIRYEAGARRFLANAAQKIEEEGFDQVDWKSVVEASLLHEEGDASAPDHASVNHALAWLGIDIHVFRRKGPPPSAFQYSEIPSSREIEVAVELLDKNKRRSGDDFHLASIALRILALHPHRWDAIAHLRLCDFSLNDATPFFVITPEAGAALKTHNAARVLKIDNGALVQDLKEIHDLRSARFPNDLRVPIFGDHNNPRTNETADRVHELIVQALWRSTGSSVIQTHDVRHFAISDRVEQLIQLSLSDGYETLRLRQGLFECAVDAGQSCPQVSIENYGHDFDKHRTHYYDVIKNKLGIPPSDAFVSYVTDIPEGTYRKRRSRHLGYEVDVLEGFNWEKFRSGPTRIFLYDLVSQQMQLIPWENCEVAERLLTHQAIYIGLRLLGDSPDVARLAALISDTDAQDAEEKLKAVSRFRITPLLTRSDINRQRFIDSILRRGLVVAMNAVRPPASAIARLVGACSAPGDELSFRCVEDILDLSVWAKIWAANDISTELLFKAAGRSVLDDRLITTAKQNSFSRVRVLPARHFQRGSSAILRFFGAHERNTEKRVRASPQISFAITACALTVLTYSQGGHHE